MKATRTAKTAPTTTTLVLNHGAWTRGPARGVSRRTTFTLTGTLFSMDMETPEATYGLAAVLQPDEAESLARALMLIARPKPARVLRLVPRAQLGRDGPPWPR